MSEKTQSLVGGTSTVLLVDLPLGARFVYANDKKKNVWVLLERHGCGLIASWEGNILKFVGQSICSAENSEEEMRKLRVISID